VAANQFDDPFSHSAKTYQNFGGNTGKGSISLN